MRRLISRLAAWPVSLVLMIPASGPAMGQSSASGPRVVKMTIHPAKEPTAKDQYLLLPAEKDRTPGDAAPLYDAVAKELEKDPPVEAVRDWVKGPLAEMPLKQAKEALAKAKDALGKAEQAARCKECRWEALHGRPARDEPLPWLNHYRALSRLIALQMRCQIADRQYDQAIRSAQTGFSFARQLASEDEVISGLVGVAAGSLVIEQLEQFIEDPQAPSLCWALEKLPSPLVDLSEPIKADLARFTADPDYRARPQSQQVEARKALKVSHDRVQALALRLDQQVAALRCIEGLRLYAARHDGKLPPSLDKITEVAVPNDPAIKKPFAYRMSGETAILELPPPKGGQPRDGIRYELTLAK